MPKRKATGSSDNSNYTDIKSSLWTASEKSALLEGIQERGVFDLNYLQQLVSTKSIKEIEFFIDRKQSSIRYSVQNKAESSTVKKNQSSGVELNPSDLHKDSSASNEEQANIYPPSSDATQQSEQKEFIKKWINYIPRYRPFSSHLIGEAYSKLAKSTEPPEKEDEINFQRIYEYITLALSGKVTPALSPINSSIVYLLLKRLRGKIDTRQDINNYLISVIANSKKDVDPNSAPNASHNTECNGDAACSSNSQTLESLNPNSAPNASHDTECNGDDACSSNSQTLESLNPSDVLSNPLLNPFHIPKKYLA